MQSNTRASPPLASVVIPCYRQAQFLTEAVQSCLNQTYSPLEIVVVNDGSDDNTQEVAASFGNAIVYVYQQNKGLSGARNTGVAHAKGSFIKFLDADDFLHPEQIARQVAATGGDEYCVSMTALRLFQDSDPGEFVDHIPSADNLLPDLFKDIDWGGVHAFLIPKILIERSGGFNERLPVAEDWDFLCRIGLQDPKLVTDERVGGYYRLRSGSMSSQKDKMARTVAQLLVSLHATLRASGKRDWFGEHLLGAHRRAYRRLLENGVADKQLQTQLLNCIRELAPQHGLGELGKSWKYRTLVRACGYEMAEGIRAASLRFRSRRKRAK